MALGADTGMKRRYPIGWLIILLLLFTTKANAILVQNFGMFTGSSCTTDMAVNFTVLNSGDTLVAQAQNTYGGGGTPAILSFSDNRGNTWSSTNNCVGNGTFQTCYLAESHAINVVAGSTLLTMHLSDNGTPTCSQRLQVAEYTPLATATKDISACLDNAVNSTTFTVGPVTTTHFPDLLVGIACGSTIAQGHTSGPSNSFNILNDTQSSGGSSYSMYTSYIIDNSVGAISTQYTVASSDTHYGLLVALQDSPTAVPTASPTPTPIPTAIPTASPIPTTSPTPRPLTCSGSNLLCNAIIQGYLQLLPHHLNEAPGAPVNGQSFYCDNCQVSTIPCSPTGTGSIAKYLNNQWDCR